MKVTFKLPDTKKQLSPEVIDLLDNMLQIEPHQRFSMTDVIGHPWLADRDDRSL